ncbi:MAG: glycoside hydrolase family 6 protein, partial [Actinomycetes bacterium]
MHRRLLRPALRWAGLAALVVTGAVPSAAASPPSAHRAPTPAAFTACPGTVPPALTGLPAAGLTRPVADLATGWRPPGPPTSTPAGHALGAGQRLFVPPPDPCAVWQGLALLSHGDIRDARLIAAMVSNPQAVWLTGGTPAQVQKQVRQTMLEAKLQRAVPTFVAYDIPGRDCAQYSTGGATSQTAYAAWVDGVARGIGGGKAVVLLEPDSLGLLPSRCSATNFPFTDTQRFAELNTAVNQLERQPDVSVYLDGTNSAWLPVGTIAQELDQAGVERAQGFFVNVSNYQTTTESVLYGTWISDCLAYANNPEQGGWRLGHYDYCASQYYPATQSDVSTWSLTTQWYAV